MSNTTTTTTTHRFLYKIFPASAAPSLSLTSAPGLPTHLPLSPLDASDGFIHLSTASQSLSTATLFFSDERTICIGTIPLDRLDTRQVKWEVEGSPGCAHLYNATDGEGVEGPRLGSGEIVDVRAFERAEGEGRKLGRGRKC